MKMTFRWYDSSDRICLAQIRQIPCVSGVVSAVYSVPPGELWPEKDIQQIKHDAEVSGLGFEVVESVPVHEEIKYGGCDAGKYIRVFAENLRRLGKAGVKVVCYNFMPVFDWLRSDLRKKRSDGSYCLAYDDCAVRALDPNTIPLSLPGWDASYSDSEIKELLAKYKSVTHEKLWENRRKESKHRNM